MGTRKFVKVIFLNFDKLALSFEDFLSKLLKFRLCDFFYHP